jgi:putative membrane protein
MSPLFAFLHHIAAFAVVATIATEFVLLRGEIDARAARTLRIVDAVYGASAGALLLIGALRVFYFEKGSAYYFNSAPFYAKMGLFLAVGLLSIHPTLTFRAWGNSPNVDARQLRLVRRLVHWELAAIVGILLCAALMARGIGFIAR